MASLKDIADASGVSIRTVSRALKQSGYVGEETRERIMEAAKRLGYRPNLAARSLKTGKSYEIGVILGSTDTLHMEKLE
ncbi:MAG: LacI family DNA-binding transcriptional regulator, partial [Planctomycetes bacterium]|nr:LacI family DNA-binding transcriptional regulator [Planctomycetota bacterium]